tara:strand:- start:9153 stop:10244 length:1092 start_codon:yes stop_codon:yes gene_type:complete
MIKFFFIISTISLLFIQNVHTQQKKSIITNSKIVKIGLLIGDKKSNSAQNAAEMAIEKANKIEGINGLHFQLVVRSMEGPWGTGSKEAVDLIFKENVWAILGSHDGRNAHLVEQVITKTRVLFLSAWASDPTLSQAFVPWYFSCVPNDNQQANALIDEIYNKRKITKIATISDNSYDSKLAVNSFVKKIKTENRAGLFQFFYDSSSLKFNKLLDQINEIDVNTVILFGQSFASKKIIMQMHQNKMHQTVFATLSLLGDDKFESNNSEVATFGNGLENERFHNEFQKKYGKKPSAVAVYAFDGMNIIIDVIRKTGFDRTKIQETMAETNYKGLTGFIQFDEKGNRVGAVRLIEIIDGIPVTIER